MFFFSVNVQVYYNLGVRSGILLGMSIESTIMGRSVITLKARKRLFSGMNQFVSFEVSRMNKFVFILCAGVQLLSCVYFDMP